jgi:hypothetical protein
MKPLPSVRHQQRRVGFLCVNCVVFTLAVSQLRFFPSATVFAFLSVHNTLRTITTVRYQALYRSSDHKRMIVSPPSIRYFERRGRNDNRSELLLSMGDNDIATTTTKHQRTSPLLSKNPAYSHDSNTKGDVENPTTSFTSENYIDIVHSSNIVRIFILHATIYYTLSIVGFSYIVESWPIIDSVYYATTLFCTIGFGDIAPGNTNAQLYTIGLALYGISFLGILLGAVIDYYLEYQNYQNQKRCRQVGSQVLSRLKEKRTNHPIERDSNTNQSSNITLDDDLSLLDDIVQLLKLEIPIISVAILFAILIGHYEHWTVVESLYWFVISGTTVGFGDYYPQLSSVKLFCVLYLPFAVAVLGDLLRRIIGIYINRKRRLLEKQFLARSLSLADLDIMDADRSGRVDKAEFLAYMLCTLQKVSKEDVNEIMELFHKLDVDHDNYLTKSDLVSDEWIKALRSSIEQSI